MSAATATAEDAAAPKKGGKKKLILILAVVLLLVLGGGGAALFMMKKKQAEADAEEEGDAPAHVEKAPAAHAPDISHPPTFVPLENFTVNLADKDAERYAQIGVTLQVDDPKFAEGMKAFMPAIRNGILMVLAHKTSEELLSRDGKENLAEEIMREAVRPMGIEADDEADDHGDSKKKKKRRKPAVHNPVTQVLFSSFIVQ